MLAQAALVRGRNAEAIKWLDQALAGDPNHALAAELLADLESGVEEARPSLSV